MGKSIFKKWGESLKQIKDKYFKGGAASDCAPVQSYSPPVNVPKEFDDVDNNDVLRKKVLTKNKRVGSKRIPRGQKIYKMNLKTFSVTQVQLNVGDLGFYKDGTMMMSRSFVMEPNHLYDHALNDRNARRRFLRTMKGMLGQAKVR